MYKLSDETMNHINKTVQEALGMSYEEYCLLDCDEQEKIMKKNHKKDKKPSIMFIGDNVYTDVIDSEEMEKRLDDMYCEYGGSSFQKVKNKVKNIFGGK